MKSREDASVQPRTECISPPCCSFSRAGGWGHPWVGVSQLRDDALLKFLPPTSIPAHPQVLKLTETCPAGEAENTNPLHNLSEPQSLFISLLQNYMNPLKLVLTPQDMEAIFINLEVTPWALCL